jgi:CMP-N-acetylneuraminic acid synthetase
LVAIKDNFFVIIPARGGSKRLPGKNTMLLNGIPLIAHSIGYALENGFEGRCFVSTDDEGIAKIARQYGAIVLERPGDIATDLTSTVAVMQYHLNAWLAIGQSPTAMVLLQPTNPMRPKHLLRDAMPLLEQSGRESLVTFSSLNRKFGKIENNSFLPENYKAGQRVQDLEKRYYENGLLYITKAEAILRGEVITADCWPMLVDTIHSQVDIDELEDLLLADCLMKTHSDL